MRKILFSLLFCTGIIAAKGQQLTGRWYSADSSRIYEIKPGNNQDFDTVLKTTHRKGEKAGCVILKNLTWNPHKKRYEGLIYTVNDDAPPVPVKKNSVNITATSLPLSLTGCL
ncbi:MAG: hypothetical protein JST86_10365 [Bacteroidetes bacterium]|nr:hypothetical protein [Bacteroidota bacterium]